MNSAAAEAESPLQPGHAAPTAPHARAAAPPRPLLPPMPGPRCRRPAWPDSPEGRHRRSLPLAVPVGTAAQSLCHFPRRAGPLPDFGDEQPGGSTGLQTAKVRADGAGKNLGGGVQSLWLPAAPQDQRKRFPYRIRTQRGALRFPSPRR